jgi:hypothetical protein
MLGIIPGPAAIDSWLARHPGISGTSVDSPTADQPNPMRDVVSAVSAAVSLLVGWCIGELPMC